MKLLEHTITVPTEYTPVYVFPFACVHKDNEGHSARHWQAYLDEVQQTKYAVAFGLGDYYDWLRTHARDFLYHYRDDKDSFKRLHDYRREAAKKFADELEPIADKLAFLSLGNHHHEFPDGTNDVQEMCRHLNVQYGGHGGFLRLKVKCPNRGAHFTFTILYHHGEKIGGGRTIGGDINAMAHKAEGWEFDVGVFAHNHKKHGTHIPVVGCPKRGDLKLIEYPKAFIRAGCFMRGYVRDCVTYAEAGGLMNPTAIGHVRLDILPKKQPNEAVGYEFKTYY